ncbi:hypothetical protein ACVIHI_004937 [Bradyrhizobium sp. USDA 4524]|nr:hypothetical protein [Bradyrhizobium sp. USDA 4538]MCP1902708.1 hypothetical protein [Bradyrhizobium sp. USDA 4537]MCP1991635.1 hypothetical protein [Bradyrhizobium sp. USDA 4539]
MRQPGFSSLRSCRAASSALLHEDVEGEALATLVVNRLRGGLKVAAIKAPEFGDRRKAMLEDIAILTGARLISDDLGTKLESVELSKLGAAPRDFALHRLSSEQNIPLDVPPLRAFAHTIW